mgnify:CR=1 FL=1
MKVGDLVIILDGAGEFQYSIEGTIIRFYEEDKAIVSTKAGHDWMVDKSRLRVIKKKTHSTWNM